MLIITAEGLMGVKVFILIYEKVEYIYGFLKVILK